MSAPLSSFLPVLELRARVLRAIRQFFDAHQFLEVETPLRIPAPALETHVDAIPADGAYLRTSPELHMKRLLAAGCARIYQLGSCFRRGERGERHHPEFCMLEWYRAHADYQQILADTQKLLRAVAEAVPEPASPLGRQAREIMLSADWTILTVAEAFNTLAGWDPLKNYDADRFDFDMVTKVEPNLPRNQPVILLDYPAEAAALARRKPENSRVAERWELYINGLELANAFSELIDPIEQRQRFEISAAERKAMGKTVYSLDKPFLKMLATGMPPSAGIALGVDRLVMLLAGAESLDEIMPFRADPEGKSWD